MRDLLDPSFDPRLIRINERSDGSIAMEGVLQVNPLSLITCLCEIVQDSSGCRACSTSGWPTITSIHSTLCDAPAGACDC